MMARGVTVMLGTDGVAADILGAARLMASLFRDARIDQTTFPAATVLELATSTARAPWGCRTRSARWRSARRPISFCTTRALPNGVRCSTP